MIERGFTYDLIVAGLACGVLGFLILRLFLSTAVSSSLALLKVAIPLFYFALFNNGTWQIIDDVLYLNTATTLVTAGYNPINTLTDPTARSILLQASNGPVLLYWWWNVLAEWLFGVHYYSPVFLNIVVVALAGWYVYRTSLAAGFSAGYSRALAVFVVLHWDLVAWSGVLNLKDPLVLLLTVSTLLYLLQLSDRGLIGSSLVLSKLIVSLALLSMVRFYVTALLMASYALWLLLRRQKLKDYLSWGIAGAFVAYLMRPFLAYTTMFQASPVEFLFGIIHFWLTPQPWSIDPSYSFLFVPSILHWLFFVPALVGMYVAWRRSVPLRLLLIYLALVTAFYAAAPDLQGPRQRVQVSFIWAWMEFHFFYLILSPVSSPTKERLVSSSPVPEHGV